MTPDLASWLLSDEGPIAEDERVARSAMRPAWRRDGAGTSTQVPADGVWTQDSGGYECQVEGIGFKVYDEGGHDEHQAEHIAQWDPARVLAECAAKRKIIEAWRDADRDAADPEYEAEQQVAAITSAFDDALLALAQPYAGRPGWRPEWAIDS